MELALFESLLKAATRDEILASAQRIAKSLGYDHFMYGLHFIKPGETQLTQYYLSTYPEHWSARYVEMGYLNLDPTVKHCLEHSVPLIWTKNLFSDARGMYSEARQAGVSGGASFPIHGPRLDGVGALGLARAEDADQTARHALNSLAHGQLLSCYLHEAVRQAEFSQAVPPVQNLKLTPRETECLKWVSQGKSSWEIAEILNISERTVIYYIDNVNKKLDCVNRRQSVVRAIALGIIVP